MFLLVCAVALSLSAQLAVAKPGLSGWLLSAVPALAFLGLSKLVLTTAPAPTADRRPVPVVDEQTAPDDTVSDTPSPVREPDRPRLVPVPATAFIGSRNGTGEATL